MFYFTIDSDLNVAAVEKPIDPEVEPDKICFSAKEELLRIGADWPGSKLVALWNSFAGIPGFADCKPVNKVRSNTDMLGRIWKVIQRLADSRLGPTEEEIAAAEASKGEGEEMATKNKLVRKPKAAKAAKTAKVAKPAAEKKARKARASSNGHEAFGPKTLEVVAMLQRKSGATIAQIMERTGWGESTVRAALGGTIKRGAESLTGKGVRSEKSEKSGERTYYAEPV
jgi:hypothetical protein